MSTVHRFLICLLFGAIACSDAPTTPTPDAGTNDAGTLDAASPEDAAMDPDAGTGVAPDHRFSLEILSHYEQLQSAAREVKFLAVAPDGALPGPLSEEDVVFSNTARFPLHLQYLRSLEGLEDYSGADYGSATRNRGSRQYIPGNLFHFPDTPHPAGGVGVVAYTFAVAADQTPPDVAAYATYDRMLGAAISFPAEDIVLIGATPEQESWLAERETELRAAGVTFLRQADLRRPAIEIYSPGESYGYLNVLAPAERIEDYGPRDIVLADAAHDDVSLLSGLITTFAQSDGSHLNLRLREKRLPNLRWAGARSDAEVLRLTDRLVHIVVREVDGEPGVLLEEATLADAEAFWRMRQPPLGAPDSDLDERAFLDFAALTHESADAFGVKAANLGELHDALPEDNRAVGFGIPFAYYAQHIAHNNLQDDIDALLADTSLEGDRDALSDALKDLRRSIRRGGLAPGLLDALGARIDAVFGADGRTTFLRLRSSTNAEDLEAFSGAGLYDSKTGCLADDLDGDDVGPSRCFSEADLAEIRRRIAAFQSRLDADPSQTWIADEIADLEEDLVEEKPMTDALQKVWRSLWNLRAFEERAYYGIPHTSVFMGIAVMPSFVFETREAVILTNLPSDDGELYQVFSQVDDIGVVRPSNPSARPEELRFFRGTMGPERFEIVRRSTESPDADLWSNADRLELANLLLTTQDHFEAIYADISPLRLDIEVEVTRDGFTVLKQARPYLGAIE